MRKPLLNILEVLLVFGLAIFCYMLILQNTSLQNTYLFGYSSIIIREDSNLTNLKSTDVILVKKANLEKLEVGSIIVYKNSKQERELAEVTDIKKNENNYLIRIKTEENELYINDDSIYGEYKYHFITLSFLNSLTKTSKVTSICILTLFGTLLILELVTLTKEIKRKELEVQMKYELSELKSLKNNTKKSKELEKNIKNKLKEIEDAKRDYKKIDNLEKTIQIPLEEIQKELKKLNKTSSSLEDTKVLFTSDDIKEAIAKDLKDVAKKKRNNKK